MLVTYCFEAPSLQVTLSQQVQVSLECHGMPCQIRIAEVCQFDGKECHGNLLHCGVSLQRAHVCVGTAARSCKRSLTSRRRNAKLWLGTKTIATCQLLTTLFFNWSPVGLWHGYALHVSSNQLDHFAMYGCYQLCNALLQGLAGLACPSNLTMMRQTDTFNRHRCWNQNSVSNVTEASELEEVQATLRQRSLHIQSNPIQSSQSGNVWRDRILQI
jgi:hypothetical protein